MLTLRSESAHALIRTPNVSNITLTTCSKLYRLPRITPASIVVTLPKLRKMMCTGTLMSYAKAQLFSMLIAKCIVATSAHLETGTLGGRKLYLP